MTKVKDEPSATSIWLDPFFKELTILTHKAKHLAKLRQDAHNLDKTNRPELYKNLADQKPPSPLLKELKLDVDVSTGTGLHGIIDADNDADEYWEIDDWINSINFAQWIVRENKLEITEQLDKECVWELLNG
jgi:hypothetical protein|tara:strand:- start:583 stop:978 length:396 start_codon:yes stop_codon:yes gene_type:complete